MDNKHNRTRSKMIRLLGANQAAYSYGNNAAVPFFSYYLIRLGAGAFHLGVLSALQNLLTNAVQFPSAYLSDKMGKRLPFIAAGLGISGVMLLLITLFTNLWVIIFLICIQAAAISIYFPSWSAMMGDKIKGGDRGFVLSEIAEASIIAGIMGAVSALVFLSLSSGMSASSFRLPFIVGAFSFFLAVLFTSMAKEVKRKCVKRVTKVSELDPNFKHLMKIQCAYNLFMSFSWPLFPLTIAKVLDASNTDIAFLTLIPMVATALVQPFIGKAMDRTGPVWLIQASRFIFVAVPFVYAFAPDIRVIFALCVAEGISNAMINVAFTAYILDSSPPKARAEYFAYYNLGIGIVTFIGALVGGMATIVLLNYYELWTAMLIVYMFSGAGRFATSLLFLGLKDSKDYPSTPLQIAYSKMEMVRLLRRRH